VPIFLAIFSISYLISGKIEVNSKGIFRKEFWGYCFLSWDNVHHVEVSPSRGKIVFKGDAENSGKVRRDKTALL
jgi:hypothetical protein